MFAELLPYKKCCLRRQIDLACRLPATQRDDLEPVGGLEIAATKGGAVKSRRLGQICVGANNQAAKQVRDPVAPAQRSVAAMKKAQTRTLEDGSPTQSFQTLLARLQTVVRNTCRSKNSDESSPTFQVTTTPDELQRRALALIDSIEM